MSLSSTILTFLSSTNHLPLIIMIGSLLLLVIVILTTALIRLSRKNEALKYEFITIIAHKYRTPLTQVKWLIEGLLSNETDSYKKESLDQIVKSNQNLISLTGTLIELTDSDHSSKVEYNLEKIPVCKLVRDVGEGLKTLFHEKNIFFAVQCPTDDVPVRVDRTRIEFVLQVLMENAYLYSSTGKNVDVFVSHSGHRVEISVIDHGIGIDPRDLPNMFSKFFRAENATSYDTEGFGVSLFMANTIVRRHGGKMDVSSEGVGKGATFKIILPIVQ